MPRRINHIGLISHHKQLEKQTKYIKPPFSDIGQQVA